MSNKYINSKVCSERHQFNNNTKNRLTSLKNKKPESTPKLISIEMGFDTEYTTNIVLEDGIEKEYPKGLTAQLSIKGVYSQIEHKDCIASINDRGYTAFVFSNPKEDMLGVEYLEWLEGLVISTATHCGHDLEDIGKKYCVNLRTFYSNAELSLIIPNKKAIEKIYEKKLSRGLDIKDFKVVPLHGTGMLTGCALSDRVVLNISDVRPLTDCKSLKKLGESLNFPKGDCDFRKHDALWYLENDRENFLNYAMRDATIPLMWFEEFHSNVSNIVEDLKSKDLIENTLASKMMSKSFATTASVTDYLMLGVLQNEGKAKKYRDTIEDLKKNIMPSIMFSLNKGGLNKSSHGFKPEFIYGVDSHDISGAYATAIENFQMPIIKPKEKVFGSGDGETMRLKDLARICDHYGLSYVLFDLIELPKDTPENKRILNLYDEDGECVTALSNSGVIQFATCFEICGQALLTPNAKVRPIRIYGWKRKELENNYKHICFSELFKELREGRVEAKRLYGKGCVQEKTYKLLGNGGVGKLAQNKEVFNSELLMSAISKGGDVNSLAKDISNSKCYNPLFFNFITGLVRVTTGLSYALSDGVLAVTDSVACPTGKFKNSIEIANLIKKKKLNGDCYDCLERSLRWFSWEKERDDCVLQIYKERDYAYLESDVIENVQSLEKKVKNGLADSESLKDIKINKVAKRGFHQSSEISDREKGEEFVLLGNKRFRGKPIKQNTKRLTKLSEMLTCKNKNLNQSYINGQDSAGMGSYNLKYDCESLLEFKRRKRLKQICRNNGFADQLHLIKENPELLKKFEKKVNCRINGNYKDKIPSIIRRGLAWLLCVNKKISSRGLEKLVGIGKSSLNRWKKELESSKNFKEVEALIFDSLGYDVDSVINKIIESLKRMGHYDVPKFS